MPNWSSTSMYVVGKKENIVKFVEYLDNINKSNKDSNFEGKYFYRSFPNDDYETMVNMITEVGENNLSEVTLSLDCAWSSMGCLEQRGTRKAEDVSECYVLSEVTAELGLAVEVYSEECGMAFEEHAVIINGNVIVNENVEHETTDQNEDSDYERVKGYDWDFGSYVKFFNSDGTPKEQLRYRVHTTVSYFEME